MTDHNLDDLAISTGAIILRHDGGEKGRYYGRGTISLRTGLGYINARCTLAHELGHHILGHDPQATGWILNRQERDADRYAAELLISPVEYAMAERLFGPNPAAIAHELEVTRHLIHVWRNLHATRQGGRLGGRQSAQFDT